MKILTDSYDSRKITNQHNSTSFFQLTITKTYRIMQWCSPILGYYDWVLHAIPGQDLAFIRWMIYPIDKIFHLGVFIGAWLLMRIKTKYAMHAFRYTFIVYALYGLY